MRCNTLLHSKHTNTHVHFRSSVKRAPSQNNCETLAELERQAVLFSTPGPLLFKPLLNVILVKKCAHCNRLFVLSELVTSRTQCTFAHISRVFCLVLQFGHMMDSLFKSFNGSVSVTNFAELSGSIFSWLEEYCKPQVRSFLEKTALFHTRENISISCNYSVQLYVSEKAHGLFNVSDLTVNSL